MRWIPLLLMIPLCVSAYAVAQDNDGGTWRAYRARYWPSLFLIDKRGHLRYTQVGEGAYARTEQAIQDLLKETYQGED